MIRHTAMLLMRSRVDRNRRTSGGRVKDNEEEARRAGSHRCNRSVPAGWRAYVLVLRCNIFLLVS